MNETSKELFDSNTYKDILNDRMEKSALSDNYSADLYDESK